MPLSSFFIKVSALDLEKVAIFMAVEAIFLFKIPLFPL